MDITLYRGALVLQDGSAAPPGEPSDILVTAGRIERIGPVGTLAAHTVVDVSGTLAAPGLINGHLHSWDYFIKGRAENLPLEIVMAHLRPLVPLPLAHRHVYLRTMMTAIETLRSGSTTVVDDLSLGQRLQRSDVDAALDAYEDSGLRAYVGFSMIDKPVVESWPFIGECFDAQTLEALRALPRPDGQALLDLVRSLAGERHPSRSRVGVIVAPSAPQRCSDDFLRACRALADELDLPVIVHVLETRLQAVTADLFYGRSMVEHLDALGFLKAKTSLVHGVWLTDRDRDLIARAGASVQYNPWSNASIGSGVADFDALHRAGINVGMGSDGCGVTFNCSMLLALKFGVGMGRIRTSDTARWPDAEGIWNAATVGGAKALGREGDLGRLAEGYKADMVFYDLDDMPLVPLNAPIRQLVHSQTGRGIDTVVVDGRRVLHRGSFVSIDEAALIAEFKEVHREMLPYIERSEAASRPMIEGLRRVYERALAEGTGPGITAGTFDAACCGARP